MKKRIIILLIIFIISATIIYFVTKPKIETWEYNKLPNNYTIEKITDTKIIIKKGNKKLTNIDNYISEYKYGNRYISLKCLESKKNNIIVKFYIIDTANDDTYGPYYTESTYLEVEKKIIDEEQNTWIATTINPNK